MSVDNMQKTVLHIDFPVKMIKCICIDNMLFVCSGWYTEWFNMMMLFSCNGLHQNILLVTPKMLLYFFKRLFMIDNHIEHQSNVRYCSV